MLVLDATSTLLVLAAVIGLLNHHFLKLPFTIGLTIAGLVASLAMLGVDAVVPAWGLADGAREAIGSIDFANAILYGMLSVLLYAGALHVDLDLLFDKKVPILTLATLGILVSTAVAGGLAYLVFSAFGLDVPFAWCVVFGALISPTDPIAVLGIMKAAGAPKSLELKVVGESLFNDGVGVVLFLVLVSWASATTGVGDGEHAPAFASVAGLLAQEVLGGVVLGLVVGYGAYKAINSVDEPNLEILLSVATVLGLNLVATKLHLSGPLAAVVAGLLIGNEGRRLAMSKKTRENLDAVWYFIDEALNAILFLLIGLEVFALELEPGQLAAGLVLIPLVLLARAGGVAGPLTALKTRFDFMTGTRRVLIWGGLKGGVSVALAMKLPDFPGRGAILTAAYATVVFSIIVQGLTVGRLIERVAPRASSPAG
jgi:CPA1 family monovalent cation:H+ antiporter